MSMSEQPPIRVLVVDDHAVVRGGLGAFLRAFDDLEPVGEAASGPDALRVCAAASPDTALTVTMPRQALALLRPE
jgi:two-component system, NarL family, response regulator LiaR